MIPLLDTVVGAIIYAVGTLILAVAAVLFVRLRRTKGLKVGLAHLLTSPPHRRLFFATLFALFICLVIGGYLRATVLVFDYAATLLNLVIGMLWIAAAVAILALVLIALGAESLPLQEELRLEEDHPELLESVFSGTPSQRPTKSSMYVVPPRKTAVTEPEKKPDTRSD